MNLKLAVCSLVMLSCAVARAGEDVCRDGLHGWAIGGFPFREEASALLKYGEDCPAAGTFAGSAGRCDAIGPDGFKYSLYFGIKKGNEAWVFHKERLVKPDEQLPFGIVPGDSAAVALKKTGGRGGYTYGGRRLGGVAVECGPKLHRFIGEGPADYYDLLFLVDDDGKVNGVYETDQDESGTRY